MIWRIIGIYGPDNHKGLELQGFSCDSLVSFLTTNQENNTQTKIVTT